MAENIFLKKDTEFELINQLYDECLDYLTSSGLKIIDDHEKKQLIDDHTGEFKNDQYDYKMIDDQRHTKSQNTKENSNEYKLQEKEIPLLDKIDFVNELKSNESLNAMPGEMKSERLRKLSQTLPKIIITQSNTSLDTKKEVTEKKGNHVSTLKSALKKPVYKNNNHFNYHEFNYKSEPTQRFRTAYGDFPKRLVSKNGIENVALISNVPYGKIRLLNDAFHTLINLRWRWIVIGTVVVHFAIWLVFAVFWYITALAHYDFDPDPPKRTCVTGGKDFVTIFLASVEAQIYWLEYSAFRVPEIPNTVCLVLHFATTIGFGDRAIDEECPESIFLFVMQLILGTGLSGVLTCVVYAKLTRPEKLSRDGVGFSKKAVISMRDGRLCLMIRAWDLNYDHIISSEFTAHFINTHRTKEGEVIRYFARSLPLQQKQFLLWPVTLVHEIDVTSPLYTYTPQDIANNSYEITVGLKGASASMGTFTQSQSSYLPREVLWGHRFPPVVKYDTHKQKYAIEHAKLEATEPVNTPCCSASELYRSRSSSTSQEQSSQDTCPGTPGSFSEKISTFHVERTSSFKRKDRK